MDSEIIDISSLNFGDHNSSLKSSNFGSGIELLMNDKKRKVDVLQVILIYMI